MSIPLVRRVRPLYRPYPRLRLVPGLLWILSLLFLVAACGGAGAVEFAADFTDGEAPLSVAFTNKSEGTDEFWWDFGDGSSPIRSSKHDPVTHVYTRAGTHTVTLAPLQDGLPDLGSSATLIITVERGPPSRVLLDPSKMFVGPGEERPISVSAFDRFDNALSDFGLAFRADQRAGQIDADGRFVAGTNAGVYQNAITAVVTDGPVTQSASAEVTVLPGPLDRVTIEPSSAVVEVAEGRRFTAAAVDEFGNPIPGLTYSFRSSERAGRVDNEGRLSAGTAAGVYENAVTVEVSQGSVTRTAAATVIVKPGPLDRVTIDPASATMQVATERGFTAEAIDRFGNSIPDLTYVFQAAAEAGQVDNEGRFAGGTDSGVYPNAVVVTATEGPITRSDAADLTLQPGPLDSVAIEPSEARIEAGAERRFTATALDRFGNPIPGLAYVFKGDERAGRTGTAGAFVAGTRAGTFERAVTVEVAQDSLVRSTSADVTIEPGPLHTASIEAQSVTLQVGREHSFRAMAFDEFGNPLSGVAFAFLSDGQAGQVTDDGVFVAGTRAGLYEDAITVVFAQGPRTSAATADVSVTPGPLDRVTIDPASASLGVTQTQRFVATAVDQFENPIPDLAYVFSADEQAGRIDASGHLVARTVAGTFGSAVRVEVTDGSIVRSASADLTIDPGPLDRVVIEPASGTLVVTEQLRFTVTALDEFGNPIPGLTTRFSSEEDAGLVSDDGVFTAGTSAGAYESALTAEVAQGSVTRSAKADLILEHGPLDRIVVTPGSLTLNIGRSGSPSAVAFDAHGNSIPEADLTWEAVGAVGTLDSAGVLTAGTVAGAFEKGLRITATLGDESAHATALVTVRPDPLDSVRLPPVQIAAGESRQLATTAVDRYGNVIDDVELSWSTSDLNAGTTSAAGMIAAGEVAGTFANAIAVQATRDDRTRSAAAPVTITPGPLSQVLMAPSPARIGMGMTQRFVAAGADRFGNRIQDLAFVWRMRGGGGSIDANGLFTAGSQAGTFDGAIEVTAARGDVTQSATTTVVVEPDRIAFMSDRDNGARHIYVMDLDGTNVERLTSGDGIGPTWSPDGRRIAYHVCLFTCEIVTMGDDGSWKTLLTGIDDRFAHWSPDGSKIAFTSTRDSGNLEVYATDVDGANQTRLTSSSGEDSSPAWSPSGSQIAFSSERDGQAEIYVMNADGSGQQRLTDNPATDVFPVWSPDGTEIVFESNRDGDFEIFVMDTDGENVRQLTFNTVLDAFPTWSPDGTRILFHSLRDGDRELYLMDRAGGNQTQITDNPAHDLVARWSPRKRGIPVSEDWIVIPNSSDLLPMTADEVTAGGRDAIVRIETDTGGGSGFVIDSTGLILTNNHVVTGTSQITVHLSDGTSPAATVVGRDLVRDLALIRIQVTGLSTLELGDLSRTPVESAVLAMGHPLRNPDLVVTNGAITVTSPDAGRNITWVEANTTVQPGSSGGPLLNLQGKVIGIVTARFLAPGGAALALSANTVGLYLDRLKAGEVIVS